jgi:hypothetical protein
MATLKDQWAVMRNKDTSKEQKAACLGTVKKILADLKAHIGRNSGDGRDNPTEDALW